ncbi:DUF2490 domain-containing protein [Lacihabitans sp. LS3-19]|uniref:DUF2490 domain-containing protein n=1 Tax=Lacihabitans sp. LS3-19 TaxID=2487335 RepID=UPI0020CF1351|nr:DUF2490 domain-containing protein [Lacihabitans sp. LS3-19]
MLFGSARVSFSQKNVTNQNLFWLRFSNQTNFKNSKFFLINEVEDRRFYISNTQHHTIQHNHLHYKIKPNVDVALGQTFSWQNPQFPDANIKLTVPEVRPFQEINASEKINPKLIFSTRFRIDERFIRNNNGTELSDGYKFNMRYRLRIQYQYLIWKNGSLKISDELMINSGKNTNFFDQNRIFISYEHKFTKNTSSEIGYLRWYQQRSQFDTYFQRDIVRFSLFQKLNFPLKAKSTL